MIDFDNLNLSDIPPGFNLEEMNEKHVRLITSAFGIPPIYFMTRDELLKEKERLLAQGEALEWLLNYLKEMQSGQHPAE